MTTATLNRLPQLAKAYRQMPNGGAALTLSNGIVGNGFTVVGRFTSDRKAKEALRQAGFTELSYGWKLKAKHLEIKQGGRWLTVAQIIFDSWTGERRINGERFEGEVVKFGEKS